LNKYTLIITEKPDAAKRIAEALDAEGKAKKSMQNNVPFYEAYRNSDIVVVPALGHLYTVGSKEKTSRDYPVFDYQWVPRYKVERGASKIRVWLKVIAKLAKNAEAFVDACDFDIEGCIIGYSILKYACGNKQDSALRMKYSTLTREELQESYSNMLQHLDFALIEAGLARHEADWLYGINLSRGLTYAVKIYSGKYATISTGRVQGPTLMFLDEREKTIKSFVSKPYWTLTAKILINGETFDFDYGKTFDNKQEANSVLSACKTKEGKIDSVIIKEFWQDPPVPFDLGSLQSEAYRIFHYAPMKTSSIAQHLYLGALISYPRTCSQKLPHSIGYRTLLNKLSKISDYGKTIGELLSKIQLKPHEGAKTDTAHPAIYPTGNLPGRQLDTPESNVLDLVVRRFIAVFGESALCQTIKISININGNSFLFTRTRTLNEGWLRFYKPYVEDKESVLPLLTEGQKVNVKRVLMKENFTKPPARYNPRSLLMKMEKEEIGTKATRAGIIQTLYDRKYIRGSESLMVSDLGSEVIDVLSKYCPAVISPELTRKLEGEMELIQEGKQTKDAIIRSTVEILRPVISELKEKQSIIGARISEALNKSRLEDRIVGSCSKCADGKLMILRSKKSGKRFVGCTNYFESKCGVTFPLPQTGKIKPLATPCKSCGCPVVYVFTKGRRRWRLCLNPVCPTKATKSQQQQNEDFR
jgi:DNA topoisomerase I